MTVFTLSNCLQLLSATVVTAELLILATLVGLCIAVSFTFLSEQFPHSLKWPVDLFVFLIRGTPLLVQFFLIYFGLAQFTWLQNSFLWTALKQPFFCAVLALALNTGGYTISLLRGALNSIPKGEIEACQAIGFNSRQAWRYVLLPRALRIALPAYSNEVIMVLKGTSLASTIALLDLMGLTRQLIAQTYAVIPLYAFAGLLYLILNFAIVGIFKAIERRYLNHA